MTDWFAGEVAERYDKSTAGMPVEPVVDFLLPFAGEAVAISGSRLRQAQR